MGGRIEYLLSGAATLQPDLAHFFRGIGVPTIEGYGLTETTAPLVGGRPGSLVAGSVGRPLPGSTVGIASNGEVLAKGMGVISGYRNPAHNDGAFLDGFFRTGDLGSLGEDGSLTLRGRLKNLVVMSTGRKVSPEPWEQAVEARPLVAHAVLVGNDRKFLVGIVVIDAESIALRDPAISADGWSATVVQGVTECVDPGLLSELSLAVDEANSHVKATDQVRSWRAVALATDLLDEFVTPTMKLKRGVVIDRLSPLIAELYLQSDAAQSTDTGTTRGWKA